MIVSDRLRFVFVHNPKVGGTSIRRRLAPLDDATPPFWKFGYCAGLGRRIDRAHIPLDDLQLAYPEAYAKVRDYRSFVFVRNPYARAASAFAEWCVRTGRKRQLARRGWARQHFGPYLAALDPDVVRSDPTWIHACPQHLFVFNRGAKVCARVGRMEDFAADFRRIAAWIGLDDTDGLDHHNDVRRRTGAAAPGRDGQPHRDWFDAAATRRITDFYACDFDVFRYERDCLESLG